MGGERRAPTIPSRPEDDVTGAGRDCQKFTMADTALDPHHHQHHKQQKERKLAAGIPAEKMINL